MTIVMSPASKGRKDHDGRTVRIELARYNEQDHPVGPSSAQKSCPSEDESKILISRQDDCSRRQSQKSQQSQGLDARGVSLTIVMCSMGTPMLGVSFMAAQLGPYLAIACFGLAAFLSAECGRLVVTTCDMVDGQPGGDTRIKPCDGDTGSPRSKRPNFSSDQQTNSPSSPTSPNSSSNANSLKPWIYPDYTRNVFGEKSWICTASQVTTTLSLYGMCIGGFACELALLEIGTTGLLNFIGDVLNGRYDINRGSGGNFFHITDDQQWCPRTWLHIIDSIWASSIWPLFRRGSCYSPPAAD